MDNEILDRIEGEEKSIDKPKRAIIYSIIMLASFIARNYFLTPVGMRDVRFITLYAFLSLGGFIVFGTLAETVRYFYRSIIKKEQKKDMWFEIIESTFSFWVLIFGTLVVLAVVRYLFFPDL